MDDATFLTDADFDDLLAGRLLAGGRVAAGLESFVAEMRAHYIVEQPGPAFQSHLARIVDTALLARAPMRHSPHPMAGLGSLCGRQIARRKTMVINLFRSASSKLVLAGIVTASLATAGLATAKVLPHPATPPAPVHVNSDPAICHCDVKPPSHKPPKPPADGLKGTVGTVVTGGPAAVVNQVPETVKGTVKGITKGTAPVIGTTGVDPVGTVTGVIAGATAATNGVLGSVTAPTKGIGDTVGKTTGTLNGVVKTAGGAIGPSAGAATDTLNGVLGPVTGLLNQLLGCGCHPPR